MNRLKTAQAHLHIQNDFLNNKYAIYWKISYKFSDELGIKLSCGPFTWGGFWQKDNNNNKHDKSQNQKMTRLASTMGNVPAEKSLSLPAVQKSRAFQQQGRGEHVARYCWQDIRNGTHLLSVSWKTNTTHSELISTNSHRQRNTDKLSGTVRAGLPLIKHFKLN